MNFKINTKSFLFSILLVPLFSISKEEKNGNHNRIKANLATNNFIEKDSVIIKNGYQLTVRNSDPKLSNEFKNNIAERFFDAYPKMLEHFNPKATKSVIIIFSDADTDHPAHAINNEITVFTKFFTKPVRDKDIDVIVHEGFHLIQAYPESKNTPGWLVEGIADYVREIYGLSNAESGWVLPGTLDDKGNKYQASYRTTARFLLWVDKNFKRGIVEILDDKCRTGTYTSEIWKKETNKTIDELWDDYVKNYNKFPNN
ncbi:basic secretory protein-like protein [Flavobacterium hydrophilum]|uniref:Secretory protein n=1 Tax=Flavobacterium hydrophilum TaxID=2211445 RepID=A0A2V4C7B9_9FLAO|nr:basic secretory protein-like protein [Flavobacterium hydrophilum]PXY47219.1 secretory protein [Flavobacterium hydrophilum]